jgi:hypothetical protein
MLFIYTIIEQNKYLLWFYCFASYNWYNRSLVHINVSKCSDFANTISNTFSGFYDSTIRATSKQKTGQICLIFLIFLYFHLSLTFPSRLKAMLFYYCLTLMSACFACFPCFTLSVECRVLTINNVMHIYKNDPWTFKPLNL